MSEMGTQDNAVFLVCERLRLLRKRLDLNIEDVAGQTGLSFSQIQRIEGSVVKKKSVVIQRGGDGRASTVITLLVFYAKRISIDFLLNFNMPVSDIPLNKDLEKEIAREKILSLIERVQEVARFLE